MWKDDSKIVVDYQRPGDRMLAVQRMADLTHAERTLLTVISYHDGPNGAYPGYERLAELTGMSRFDIARYLKRLEKKGRLSHRRRQRDTSVYRIFYDPPVGF